MPALGSLAAGPLYVLVDTAIVGHLGTGPLAGLALAGVVLDGTLALCGFLAYATTAQVGRQQAAGEDDGVKALAAQALWLAIGLGTLLMLAGWAIGPLLLAALGGGADVAAMANQYLRIAVAGIPFALVTVAGQGYLRGTANLKTPLLFVVGGNALNVVLELLFVYGLGWGLAGSPAATVIAQVAMAAGFIYRLWIASAGHRRP